MNDLQNIFQESDKSKISTSVSSTPLQNRSVFLQNWLFTVESTVCFADLDQSNEILSKFCLQKSMKHTVNAQIGNKDFKFIVVYVSLYICSSQTRRSQDYKHRCTKTVPYSTRSLGLGHLFML